MHRQSRTKPTTQRNTRQHLQKTRTKRKRNPTHGILAICRKTKSYNRESPQLTLYWKIGMHQQDRHCQAGKTRQILELCFDKTPIQEIAKSS